MKTMKKIKILKKTLFTLNENIKSRKRKCEYDKRDNQYNSLSCKKRKLL